MSGLKAVGEEPGQGMRVRWVYVAFALLAVLAGPVNGFVSGAFLLALHMQVFAGEALCGALAGAILVALGAARRQKMLDARQWEAVLLLLVPQWCSIAINSLGHSIAWLHGTGWGAALLLTLAAPLWLGLLAALDVVQMRVPRAVVGAGIAGIFAACLVVPVQAYRVAGNQAPMLVLQLLVNIAIDISWVVAAPRLAHAGTLMAAGGYLLLSATGDAAFALGFERSAWQPLDWASAWAPLLLEAAAMACVWWLWFWLLQRMTLAAFSMHALAAWAAAVVPGFAIVGFLEWRVDAALAIALAAIVVALRARTAEEQPMALGLGET